MQAKARYRIKVGGRLDERWASWFEGALITYEAARDGSTLTSLENDMMDQSSLHGMLNRLRDLNLPLVSLERIEERQSTEGEGHETGIRDTDVRFDQELRKG